MPLGKGAAMGTMAAVDFALPDEVLAALPRDPYEQLDLARCITALADARLQGLLRDSGTASTQSRLPLHRTVHAGENDGSLMPMLELSPTGSQKPFVPFLAPALLAPFFNNSTLKLSGIIDGKLFCLIIGAMQLIIIILVRSAGVAGVVQFDTAQNHFLAAGEDNQIKFWDVDNTNMLTYTEADGGLPALPRLRFTKEGNLLAVTTVDNGCKILPNADGLRTLRAFGSNRPFKAFRPQYEASSMKVSGAPVVASISPNIGRMDHLDRNSPAKPSPITNGGDTASRNIDIKPRISEEKPDKAKPWELMEVLNPQQCRVATMLETPDQARKVVSLLYTNSGVI